jgi:hypothetical protein
VRDSYIQQASESSIFCEIIFLFEKHQKSKNVRSNNDFINIFERFDIAGQVEKITNYKFTEKEDFCNDKAKYFS